MSLGINLGLGLSARGVGGNPSGLVPDDGTIIVDDAGQWDILPTAKNDPLGLKLKGKNGGVAKFIFDIGQASPGAKYTLNYTADWSALSNTGKEAFLGFGWKEADNNFHMVGNKGDDSTGLDIEQIYGTANFTGQSGFTNTDVPATNGTQAGPNWLQLELSLGGETYTLRSSADGIIWDDELTDEVPVPIADGIIAPVFGIAVFLENSDKGSFEAIIQLWQVLIPGEITVPSIKSAVFMRPDITKITVPSIKSATFFRPDITKITVHSIKSAVFLSTPDITPTLDGEFAPDSGTGTAAHTYNSIVAGPISAPAASAVAITWDNAGAVRTVSGVTFDGNAMTPLHNAGRATGLNVGCALYAIDGSQSGDIVVTFDGTVDDSHITVISLEDVLSLTPVDVGDAGAATGTGTVMTNLLVPGLGGFRIAVYANDTQGTAVSWTNADEQSDVNAGAHRHSVAVVENNSDSDIDADGASDDHQLIGVSLR